MKPIKEIKDWYITLGDNLNPYLAPEAHNQYLVGLVDGGKVQKRTSKIIDFKDGIIETCHTFYKLCGPQEGFVEYCRQNNFHIPTDEQPFRNIE